MFCLTRTSTSSICPAQVPVKPSAPGGGHRTDHCQQALPAHHRHPQRAGWIRNLLPGTEAEKMEPCLGAITDNLEALHMDDENTHGSVDYILQKVPLQFKSSTIRGCSFQHSLIPSTNSEPHPAPDENHHHPCRHRSAVSAQQPWRADRYVPLPVGPL
jgi:hypothetical protein